MKNIYEHVENVFWFLAAPWMVLPDILRGKSLGGGGHMSGLAGAFLAFQALVSLIVQLILVALGAGLYFLLR